MLVEPLMFWLPSFFVYFSMTIMNWRIFFVEESPKSANSSKLAKLQKTPKFRIFRNFTDFEIFALLGLKKKFNKIYISFTQFDVIFQENSVWHFTFWRDDDESSTHKKTGPHGVINEGQLPKKLGPSHGDTNWRFWWTIQGFWKKNHTFRRRSNWNPNWS